ncbi:MULTISPECIES: DUF1284 domain-containing protein [unclassified Aureimonas]|uniref:DUF1284 domain-containing protein n=1 Tax=unclassified Aureimonas TaxID=2615206 RepID=UPI0006F7CA04|nr:MULTISPECIES: DUF1284 domain-containing protein [unclassified Aureimonas]KQT66263.1 2Fe-2S ferredoxin [Aureimonas sp. Leaf427]KQT72452.1 2Fe-2S ferredoxin [Aureimonas sp. Leaf460]
MTVRLRPHHLLCLLTYVGKGYSAAFTANYDAVAARIAGGEPVLIVAGPDDICTPLLAEVDAHCRESRVADRDDLAARDVGRLLGRSIEPGTSLVLDPARLFAMRGAFAAGSTREACFDCPWSDLCTSVAGGGYHGTIVPHEGV